MVYLKHSYPGTVRIVREVCGETGLMMLSRRDYVPEYVSRERYLKERARIKFIAFYQKKLIKGSALESFYYRFFPETARERLNSRIPAARKIHAELEEIAARYSGYAKEISGNYFFTKREKVKTAYNVKKRNDIVEKLKDDKKFVFPKSAAFECEDNKDAALFAKKQSEIDIEEIIASIDKDISSYTNTLRSDSWSIRFMNAEIEQLDEQRARVNDLVSAAEQSILCGSMYIEHAEHMLNHMIDGEDIYSKCLEFRDALLGINKNLNELIEGMDESRVDAKECSIMDIFKNLYSWKSLYSWSKRRKQKSKEDAEIGMSIVEEALMELQPEEEKKCREE